MDSKQRVLFICTHNSARSQMAEGYMNARFGDRFEAFSAGTETTRVHPLAIEVMAEIGIDISGQRSKALEEFPGQPFDTVVTVCEFKKRVLSVFPRGRTHNPQEFSRSVPGRMVQGKRCGTSSAE